MSKRGKQPAPAEAKTRVTISLPADQREWLKERAAELANDWDRPNISDVLRRLINEAMTMESR